MDLSEKNIMEQGRDGWDQQEKHWNVVVLILTVADIVLCVLLGNSWEK